MNELNNYKEQLFAAVYNNPDAVFPEFGFKGNDKELRSHLHTDGREDGSKRKDASVIKAKAKGFVFNNGSADGIGVIDLYMQRTGKDFKTALDEMADALGIERFQWKRNEEEERRASTLQTIYGNCRTALFSPEGRATLDYLENVRNYTPELANKIGFGHLTPTAAATLNNIFGAGFAPNPSEFPLVIPLYEDGEIKALKYRRINGDGDKYRNSTGAKRIFFRYITKKVVFVEGEIDALHANAAGLRNVVALRGLSISEEDIERMKRRGVEEVVFLNETDIEEATRKKVAARTLGNISLIYRAGMEVSVATVPTTPGEKTDADKYLLSHTADELKSVIYHNTGGAQYTAETIAAEGLAEGKQPAEIARRIVRASIDFRPFDRPAMNEAIRRVLGVEVKESDIEEERLLMEEERKRKEAAKTTADLTRRLNAAASEGNIEEAARITSELYGELSDIRTANDFEEERRRASSWSSYTERLAKRPEGLFTGYGFGDPTRGEVEALKLEPGALTYVCARSSHGKSRFLLNLALNVAESQKGKVLYFVYEGSAEETLLRALTTYTGRHNAEPISARPFDTLANYFRTGETQYFKNGTFDNWSNTAATKFLHLIQGEKIAFHDITPTVEGLIQYIQFEAKNGRISAVFVDYIQKLTTEERYTLRKDELRAVSGKLLEAAKSLQLPFVLAAQLNRETNAAPKISLSNIADASEIEKDANTVVLTFDFHIDVKGWDDKKELSELCRDAGGDLSEENFKEWTKGKIYCRFLKNRFGVAGRWSFLNIDKATGNISPNMENAPDYTEEDVKFLF